MEEKLLNVIKEVLEIQDREINLSDEFRNYENWDSLAQLTLIAALDDNFGVVIESADFSKLNTISDLLEEIKKRANK